MFTETIKRAELTFFHYSANNIKMSIYLSQKDFKKVPSEILTFENNQKYKKFNGVNFYLAKDFD